MSVSGNTGIKQHKIRESIPEECEISLKHAQVHIDSAKCAQIDGDIDQLVHDADLAGRILLVVGWNVKSINKGE